MTSADNNPGTGLLEPAQARREGLHRGGRRAGRWAGRRRTPSRRRAPRCSVSTSTAPWPRKSPTRSTAWRAWPIRSVEDEAARIVAEAKQQLGRLDGLADVVGMARYGALVDTPTEDWDWVHDMVVRHAFNLVKHGGRAIAEGGGGSMVFVASISGVSSAPVPRSLRRCQGRSHLARAHRGCRAQGQRGPRERRRPGEHGHAPRRQVTRPGARAAGHRLAQ